MNQYDEFVYVMENVSWEAMKALLAQRFDDYVYACYHSTRTAVQQAKAELLSDCELWHGKNDQRRGIVRAYVNDLRLEAYGET